VGRNSDEVLEAVMELTWIAIAASLLMGSAALLIFIWAVRDQQFHSFEDVKYQVFWSDLPVVDEGMDNRFEEESGDGDRNKTSR
jgi:cbb3-type cytochrome oxidase maturation protein